MYKYFEDVENSMIVNSYIYPSMVENISILTSASTIGEVSNSVKTLAKAPEWEQAFVSRYSNEIQIPK